MIEVKIDKRFAQLYPINWPKMLSYQNVVIRHRETQKDKGNTEKLFFAPPLALVLNF